MSRIKREKSAMQSEEKAEKKTKRKKVDSFISTRERTSSECSAELISLHAMK